MADGRRLHGIDTSDVLTKPCAPDATRGPDGASRSAERVKGIEPS